MIEVLVIEDERLFRESLVRRIERFPDFTVVGTATNGIEGIMEMQRLQPNVILSDIRMPGMDGLVFLEQIRKDDSSMLVVFISGYPEFANVRKALQLGAFDYLTKPLEDEELYKVLERIRVYQQEQDALSEGSRGDHPGESGNWLAGMQQWIRDHLKEASLEASAGKAKMNTAAFSRKFSLQAGVTFIQYLTELRMERAKRLLTGTDMRIKNIAIELGYFDQRYFSELFKRHVGCSPHDYRKQ